MLESNTVFIFSEDFKIFLDFLDIPLRQNKSIEWKCSIPFYSVCRSFCSVIRFVVCMPLYFNIKHSRSSIAACSLLNNFACRCHFLISTFVMTDKISRKVDMENHNTDIGSIQHLSFFFQDSDFIQGFML